MEWKVFLELAPSGGMTYLGWLMSGTLWTLLVSLCAWVIAFTLGSIIGVIRTTPLVIPRAIATAYVELFRNIPLLVQMFLGVQLPNYVQALYLHHIGRPDRNGLVTFETS